MYVYSSVYEVSIYKGHYIGALFTAYNSIMWNYSRLTRTRPPEAERRHQRRNACKW